MLLLMTFGRTSPNNGFHVYGVTGSGESHHGYTIGLSESLGAELIMAGAHCYELGEIEKVIRSVAR
jgi:hypothetical protein